MATTITTTTDIRRAKETTMRNKIGEEKGKYPTTVKKQTSA
jgi:hypothetical protein